jgi:two-component system, chemotaxis family, protein-glutamate methylesterase/glutaminase
MPQLRVVVADDSMAFRAALLEAMEGILAGRVVSLAKNGREAVDKCRDLHPDVLTLDLEMPILDGFQVLAELKPLLDQIAVIMVSAMTKQGAQSTIRALEMGAFGFITKPDLGSREANRDALHGQLAGLFEAVQSRRAGPSLPPLAPTLAPAPPPAPGQIQLIGIGCSTGGPRALAEILPKLPKNLRVPVVVTQHMPPLFTGQLAEGLAAKCSLRIVEATHGTVLTPGTVYIAAGGKHMRVATEGPGAPKRIELTDDPPENFCRPAVDYLFRSLATVYRNNAVGVILTGMGQDGAKGLLQMRQAGAPTVGQDAATCTVYGMPREARALGAVGEELPVDKIAPHLLRLVG